MATVFNKQNSVHYCVLQKFVNVCHVLCALIEVIDGLEFGVRLLIRGFFI